MATVSDKKTLNCPLCFKTYTTPRVLPCFHTFCDKCLAAHIESQTEDLQGGSKFVCPLCEAETGPSESNLAIVKWASTFPIDTLVCSLIESSVDLDDGDDKCEPCKAGGENKLAEFWCTVCQDKLCSFCNESHKRVKLLRNHTIVSIHDHKQSNINFDRVCGRHLDKIKLFCANHRELCCDICVVTDHRQCNDIRSIDDLTRDHSQLSAFEYPSILRELRNLKKEMEVIMTERKNNRKQLLEEKDKILNDMDNRVDRIVHHLNKLKNVFREETDQLYQGIEREILEKEKALQSFVINVENSEGIMEVAETSGTSQQKFTTYEIVRSQIASHYDQLKSKLSDNVEVHLSLKSDKLLDDIDGLLNSLGSIDAIPKSPLKPLALQNVDKIMKKLTEICTGHLEKVKDLMTSPVTFVKSITRDEIGSSTWFTGGTFLGNGRLVMCDFNNKRLVELDDEYNFVEEYVIDCQLQPTDVAAGNKDNEIYVTVGLLYIYKCILQTDMTVVSRIAAPLGTCGIVVSGDNIIASTSNAVEILAQDGSTVRSIPKSKSGPESYVAISHAQRTIFHRDYEEVVCRTLEGQEVFRYQHQLLAAPRGMCVDRHGRLYVCGKDSRNIHHVSPDGQKSRVIQLHSISRPWNVALHPWKNQLLVICWKEDDTLCEVYQFDEGDDS